MVKTPAWSYSSITLFDQCPKKYYHLRVAKDIKEPDSEAMMYGKDVHTAAENFMRDGTPVPEKYAFMRPLLDKLKAIPGDKHCEIKMGLKRVDGRLVACGFFDKDVWYRGVADLIIVNKEKGEARVIDYKTGKSAKYADTKQLALMAACVFAHFPEVKKVKAGLLFVVSSEFVKTDYSAESGFTIFSELDEVLASRDVAYETEVFNPKRNFSCKAWCPVLICPHNGRNE
jgi:CRISPR/Cas system-associated exonuclease Cas4 (RecB family)